MRGAKRDNTETAARNFHSKDSFVSLDGREFLAGADWKERELEILVRDKFTCQYCGTKRPPFDVHHVVHRGDGGSDDWGNLVLACWRCHNKQHPEKQLRWTRNEAAEDFKKLYSEGSDEHSGNG